LTLSGTGNDAGYDQDHFFRHIRPGFLGIRPLSTIPPRIGRFAWEKNMTGKSDLADVVWLFNHL